ncbi:uncharacterized protein N7459_003353 [Penicillium hispanicum]|uniref:uncharacterized protein n=1 Tax=Penicillium hispanicum TaxID=1080232 RepID=UPI002542481A|nr:uncharacterized protein N7459_003353 [Penicillium hispanicum]KAJ5587588.1 hypothetical protein N7459_003353 [Penicillium hispanicum]
MATSEGMGKFSVTGNPLSPNHGHVEIGMRGSDRKPIGEMPFVFTDGMGKTEPDKRKLIRKYVMLGKNRGKTRTAKRPQTTASRESDASGAEPYDASSLVVKMRYPTIPQKVGDELSFTRFAAPVEPPLLRDVLKFSFMAKKILYPLESCIIFHKKDTVDTVWFDLLTHDDAYMHSVVFLCQAYFFLVSGQETPATERKAMVHYSQTLRLLRERLSISAAQSQVSDATILVVLYLAGHAHLVNDFGSAQHHLQGLRKLVDMRGGLYAFSYNTKLITELLKFDLAIAINNGTEPVFFRDPSVEPLIPFDHAFYPGEKTIRLDLNDDLAQAWTAMKKFCSAINSAAQRNRQLTKETLLNAIGSVMYRLVDMKHLDPTSIDEAVRLGLLAFSSHVFLQCKDVQLPHTYFPRRYRHCLLNLRVQDIPPQILAWLLVIGAISVLSPADDSWLMPWLRVNCDMCGAQGWEELRGRLKGLLWIDILHDRPGQAIFKTAMST